MEKKRIESNVSFADAEYKSFNMAEDSTLTIYMKSWEEEPFKIIFKHATQFLYRLGDVPKDLYVLSNTSSFLEEALLREYDKVPLNPSSKLFQLEDIDDFPFLLIVAESVTIIKE